MRNKFKVVESQIRKKMSKTTLANLVAGLNDLDITIRSGKNLPPVTVYRLGGNSGASHWYATISSKAPIIVEIHNDTSERLKDTRGAQYIKDPVSLRGKRLYFGSRSGYENHQPDNSRQRSGHLDKGKFHPKSQKIKPI